MIIEKFYFLLHSLFLLIPPLFFFGPLYIVKWIAWIPLLVAFHWIFFDGCILDNLHKNITTVNNKNIGYTGIIIIKFLELFYDKNYAINIYFKYCINNNTTRDIYLFVFPTYVTLTILIYRLLYINKI